MKTKQRKTTPTSRPAETHQTTDDSNQALRTNQGIPVADNQNSLKAGPRGPVLLEDFVLREKITHFDHERIPERIVHARGTGAHGFFQCYQSCADFTKAAFLQDPTVKTEVFVRFSTVAGGAGSGDMPRDVRGFAVKFYTAEGNFDLVGNNIPVFFIQDAMKFPDVVHAVKMEADRGFPQVLINAKGAAALAREAAGVDWVRDAFGHLKIIGHTKEAKELLERAGIEPDQGVVELSDTKSVSEFIKRARTGRIWDREPALRSPG